MDAASWRMYASDSTGDDWRAFAGKERLQSELRKSRMLILSLKSESKIYKDGLGYR